MDSSSPSVSSSSASQVVISFSAWGARRSVAKLKQVPRLPSRSESVRGTLLNCLERCGDWEEVVVVARSHDGAYTQVNTTGGTDRHLLMGLLMDAVWTITAQKDDAPPD